jgi:hypothetical protein
MRAARTLLLMSSSGLLLLAIMFLGSLVLWIGVPLAWLWIGSQVEGSTGSLGAAVAVMLLGVVVSIIVIVPLLGWLNRLHEELREARGLESHGQTTLEGVMVISAGVALVAFCVWFFAFSGASPIPLNLSY